MRNDHKKRTRDRHAGKRQTPYPHEHNLMASRSMPEGSPGEEAAESPAQEAAERAAGQE